MPVDLKRRKSVMARSIKLGRCVCNPKQPCPCDTFKKHNVCTCAGERMPVAIGPVPLTKFVSKAGCASKIGQADLLRMLGNLPVMPDPNVLLGAAAGDDAAIYRLNDEQSLVLTVDVFTPVVNDAYLFGQIAAANSLSDVYAMGGRPITALSIIGFPIDDLDGAIMEAILRGGIDKLSEAACPLVGGHSINDPEIKCGFAITGLIETRRAVPRDAARPGDVLVLTKPLGTGMISFAAQIGRASEATLNEAGAFMAALNKDAADLMLKYEAHACTDITGFGLAGHLVEMVRRTGVTAEIDMSRLPVFAAVEQCIEQELLSGAIERNQEYAMAWVRVEDASGERNLPILYDPQTSGGLLISLPEEKAHLLVEEMRERGHEGVSIIGRIVEKANHRAEGEVVIVNSQLGNFVGELNVIISEQSNEDIFMDINNQDRIVEAAACCSRPPAESAVAGKSMEEIERAAILQTLREHNFNRSETARALGISRRALIYKLQRYSEPCCAAPPSAVENGPRADTGAAFTRFMKAAHQPGALDERTKKLIDIALSVAQRCKPCQILQIRGALAMGITKAEIEEAAWLGIAFAGSPAMMLYREVCEEMKF